MHWLFIVFQTMGPSQMSTMLWSNSDPEMQLRSFLCPWHPIRYLFHVGTNDDIVWKSEGRQCQPQEYYNVNGPWASV